jgi:hypothetical protein
MRKVPEFVSYQGIALAIPQVLEFRCPFRGRAPKTQFPDRHREL